MTRAFTTLDGLVAPLDRVDVDTDAILPKQYLRSTERQGFGAYLFDSWRYRDPGELGRDNSGRRPVPDFFLNEARYRGAEILLARRGFGCGSSREHAVWALRDWGFRAVVAPSFGDIFFANCLKNFLLPVILEEAAVEALFAAEAASRGYRVTIDLAAQELRPPGVMPMRFEIAAFPKRCLLEGLDEIAYALRQADRIRAFEGARRAAAPWLFDDAGATP